MADMSRDLSGFLAGLTLPAAVIASERAVGGRNILDGSGPGLGPAISKRLDPLVFTLVAGTVAAVSGVGAIATGWQPGLLRGAAVGGTTALLASLAYRAFDKPSPVIGAEPRPRVSSYRSSRATPVQPATAWRQAAIYRAQPPGALAARSRAQHRGVNLTGGSTSYKNWDAATGPVLGTHYQFVSAGEVDRLLAYAPGMTTFRVVFAWEALQPTAYADLRTLTGNYRTYRDSLYALVDALLARGREVLLDVHGDDDAGFAAYRGARVGTRTPDGQKVDDLLANLWFQLAARYRASPRVYYGVTNEPHDIPAATWFACGQKVIDAIRAAGARSTIVMPGTDWTGAGTWMRNNASAWNLVDPAKNLAVQVHLYFDRDSGGGTDEIPRDTIGVERLTDVTRWCRSKGLALWVAEVGLSARSPIAAATWRKTLAFMDANRDVIAGFQWWAQGPLAWWGGYRFSLLDKTGMVTPQLALIRGAFRPLVAGPLVQA
jgi:endoglucanase